MAEGFRIARVQDGMQKKCSFCDKVKIIGCYYTKGHRRDSRCKECIKKQKAKARKMRQGSLRRQRTTLDFIIEVREIPATENNLYSQKFLREVLTNLAMDAFR